VLAQPHPQSAELVEGVDAHVVVVLCTPPAKISKKSPFTPPITVLSVVDSIVAAIAEVVARPFTFPPGSPTRAGRRQ